MNLRETSGQAAASLCLWAAAFLPCSGEQPVTHEGTDYWIYTHNPSKEKLELFLSEKPGTPNKFTTLEARLNQKGKRLRFAVNGGIFEPNFLPSGLHISGGKTIVDLNLKNYVKRVEGEFTPNFYLKPNGVFYLLETGAAGIVESKRFQGAKFGAPIRIANQSGPLLLASGNVHPILEADSTSERYRNGVGVTRDGMVMFACSVLDPKKGLSNLYHFATLFRDKLNCADALYLDGDLSYLFIRGQTPPLRETNWFGGIFAITEKKD